MFALSNARDYSFSKVPYLEREEEITDQSNFVKKKRKTPESRESSQRLKPGILLKH